MSERVSIVSSFYEHVDEEQRLKKSRHGQLEFRTTIEYIHRMVQPGGKILEVGAGTGRYSVALAKEGYEVTAIELVERNLAVLKEKGQEQIHKAIDEAIRVTKKNGVIFFAFLSVYAVLFDIYLNENLKDGMEENFTEDYKVRHFED